VTEAARDRADGPTKILLDESEIPTHWYNVVADLPEPPPPPLHPGTHEPIGPDALAPLFPMGLIQQEVSAERYIEIPAAVRDVYALWRPSPLYRAKNLERHLDTPARIYFKYEGVSPAGSHKPNTAVPQAYYNAAGGREAPDHGDRRRPVGLGARVRVRAVRARLRGVAGRRLVHPEALPRVDDAAVGRHGPLLAVGADRGRAARSWRRTRTPPARSASPSPKPSRPPWPTRRPSTRSAACSTTSCCTRR
jgi:hypothetical protein